MEWAVSRWANGRALTPTDCTISMYEPTWISRHIDSGQSGWMITSYLSGELTDDPLIEWMDEDHRPLRRNRFAAKAWHGAVMGAQAPSGTVFHSLRHQNASLLVHAGELVKTVQNRLGHASATETLDTYARLWPDSDDTTRKAVETAFSTARFGDGEDHMGTGSSARSRNASSKGLSTVSRPVGGILSGPPDTGGSWVAIHLSGLPGERPLSRAGRAARLPRLALLRVGFTEPAESPPPLVRSYRTLSPLPVRARRPAIGGFLSVALSCGSPRLAVSQHPALRSPDLPRYGQCRTAATWPTHRHPQSGTGPGRAQHLGRVDLDVRRRQPALRPRGPTRGRAVIARGPSRARTRRRRPPPAEPAQGPAGGLRAPGGAGGRGGTPGPVRRPPGPTPRRSPAAARGTTRSSIGTPIPMSSLLGVSTSRSSTPWPGPSRAPASSGSAGRSTISRTTARATSIWS